MNSLVTYVANISQESYDYLMSHEQPNEKLQELLDTAKDDDTKFWVWKRLAPELLWDNMTLAEKFNNATRLLEQLQATVARLERELAEARERATDSDRFDKE
jgi:chromosome segregation ATPase